MLIIKYSKAQNVFRGWKMAQKRSILIVDDEFGIRESLKMILKPIYQVHTAADGKEALRCMQKDKIDLVTLDLKMPGLSGIDVLRRSKKMIPTSRWWS